MGSLLSRMFRGLGGLRGLRSLLAGLTCTPGFYMEDGELIH